jgi:hypothetical protein
MSHPCPRCGKTDFVVQTPAVFGFDGEHINNRELRCVKWQPSVSGT